MNENIRTVIGYILMLEHEICDAWIRFAYASCGDITWNMVKIDKWRKEGTLEDHAEDIKIMNMMSLARLKKLEMKREKRKQTKRRKKC